MFNQTEIRPYRPADKNIISPWFKDLSLYYDGHDDNRFIEQLINREADDPLGYFTTSKEIYIAQLPQTENPCGFVCLNYKRGGSVKIGPFIVSEENRQGGIGTLLAATAVNIAQVKNKRKIYATTSHLNTPVNKIFTKLGFEVEAQYPDHYKLGSTELIWGKFLDTNHDHINTDDVPDKKISTIIEGIHQNELEIIPYQSQFRQSFSHLLLTLMSQWHDELNEEFVSAMIAGHERGLDFEQKGKIILLTVTPSGELVGLATVTPKRGGPCKLYPLIGSVEAQEKLLTAAENIAQETGSRKLYTFAPVEDHHQQSIIRSHGFSIRGCLKEPYKPGKNLVCFDKFID